MFRGVWALGAGEAVAVGAGVGTDEGAFVAGAFGK